MENIDDKFLELVYLIFVFCIAVLELRRGWMILFRKQVVYITGIPLLLLILDYFEFKELATKIKNNLSEQKNLKTSGLLGLILGILLIAASISSIKDFLIE